MSAITASNISNMTSTDTAQNASSQVTSPEKKKRMETLTYLKAHLDIIAVGLTIAFLAYSIVQLKKKQK
jgi:hypothetical protein